jgi:hypothetical protein
MQGGNMNIKFPNDHGRSMLQELNKFFNNSGKADKPLPNKPVSGDSFEKAPVEKTEIATEKPVASGEMNISFQFDLFYELSTKVEAKMGANGANRFAEVSGTVAETFMGNFNLKIDGVGSFFKSTDNALNISPETTGEFFNAVEGLADLSPEALENFLQETEDFFNELEASYGEADGAFDQIKETMQQQATAFFSDVNATREKAIGNQETDQTDEAMAAPEAQALASAIENPVESQPADKENTGLIKLAFKPDMMVTADKYQDFLKKFIDYTEKFRQQMLESFFNRKPVNKSPLINSEPTDETVKIAE